MNSVEFGDSDRSRADVAVSVIRFEEIASQPHDLKVGFEFETTTATDRRGRNGGMFFTPLPNPMFRLAHIWDGEADEATSRRRTLYLRDQWNVHDRVTLNLGLRVNFNRAAVPEQGTIFSTNPVSPRAGVAWAATADNATVIRAHYGRYHDSILTRKIGDLDTSDQSPFITSVELPDGALIEVFRSPPQAEQTTVHDGIQHSYVDQYTVGIERELLPDVTMQIQYVRRNFEQFMGIVTTNTDWAPESIRDPGPDGDLGTDDDGGLITVFRPSIGLGGHQFLYTNPQGAFRTYDAIQLIGTKRYSHNWQMQASYTWSSSRATVGNLFGTNAGLKDLSSNNSAVESGVFRSPNGLVNAEGEAPWTISELKLIGTYRVPAWGGVNVSGIYRYHSGERWGRVFFAPVGFTVRAEPRGARRNPNIASLDLRIEKTFGLLGAPGAAGLYVDVFNLTNEGTVTFAWPFSGPEFGEPFAWTDPLTVRAGIRYTF